MKKFNNSWTQKVMNWLSYITLALAIFISLQNVPLWKLFLFKDFNSIDFSVLIEKKKEPVGKVLNISGGNLQKKSADKSSFKDSFIKDLAYNQDTFWTGDNTTAEIQLNDGGLIKLEPNTMIKLDLSKSNLDNLGIAKAPEIKILTGAISGLAGVNKIKIKDDSSDEIQELGQNKNIIVKRKPMEISNKISEQKQISKPQALEPVVTAQVEELAQPVKEESMSIVPAPNRIIASPPKIVTKPVNHSLTELKVEGAKIAGETSIADNKLVGREIKDFYLDLIWQKNHKANQYEVQILDPKTLQPVSNYFTSDNFYRLKNVLFNGTLKYKINAYNNQKKIGSSDVMESKFKFNPPELKTPKEGARLSASEVQYFFIWERTNFTKSYILELSNSPNFEKIITKEVVQNFAEIKLLTGKYWWRVKSKNDQMISESSKAQSFEIVK